MLDDHFNPSINVQALFRCYRYGQTRPVVVYRLCSAGTMEEAIYRTVVTKQVLSHRIVDAQAISQHFRKEETAKFYEFNPEPEWEDNDEAEDEVLNDLRSCDIGMRWIVRHHEHSSLLKDQAEERITDEEKVIADQEEHEFQSIIRTRAQKKRDKNRGGDALSSASAAASSANGNRNGQRGDRGGVAGGGDSQPARQRGTISERRRRVVPVQMSASGGAAAAASASGATVTAAAAAAAAAASMTLTSPPLSTQRKSGGEAWGSGGLGALYTEDRQQIWDDARGEYVEKTSQNPMTDDAASTGDEEAEVAAAVSRFFPPPQQKEQQQQQQQQQQQ